jgi:hypothetical protein
MSSRIGNYRVNCISKGALIDGGPLHDKYLCMCYCIFWKNIKIAHETIASNVSKNAVDKEASCSIHLAKNFWLLERLQLLLALSSDELKMSWVSFAPHCVML